MTDKLFLILLELCKGNYITAEFLSNKLEVSRRSVYRYIDILSTSNIPIISRIGNKGGYKIGDEYLIPNIYFTSTELGIINDAITSLTHAYNPNLIASVLLKLNATGLKHNITPHNKALIAYDRQSNDSLQGKLIAIERAILGGYRMDIDYHNRNGEISSRSLAPLNFISHNKEWYLYAYCYMRASYRTFKLTRITHINTSDIKHNIDGNYPQQWSFSSEDDIDVQLMLSIDKASLYLVEEWLGIESISLSEGSITAHAIVKDNDDTIAHLLMLGDKVDIISPQSIKDKCTKLIAKMHQHYCKTNN